MEKLRYHILYFGFISAAILPWIQPVKRYYSIIESPYCVVDIDNLFVLLCMCGILRFYNGDASAMRADIVSQLIVVILFTHPGTPCSAVSFWLSVPIVEVVFFIALEVFMTLLRELLYSSFFDKSVKHIYTMFCNPDRYLRTPTEFDADEVCAICRSPLSDHDTGEPVQLTSCKHQYHRECIKNWILEDRSCPYCRSKLS